jgi:hypothetical protein
MKVFGYNSPYLLWHQINPFGPSPLIYAKQSSFIISKKEAFLVCHNASFFVFYVITHCIIWSAKSNKRDDLRRKQLPNLICDGACFANNCP